MNPSSGDTKRSQTLLRCEESPDYRHFGGVLGRSVTIAQTASAKGLGASCRRVATCSRSAAAAASSSRARLFDYAGPLWHRQAAGRCADDRAGAVARARPTLTACPSLAAAAVARAIGRSIPTSERKQIAAARAAEDRKKAPPASPTILMPASRTCSTSCLARRRSLRRTRVNVPEPDPSDKTPQDKARERRPRRRRKSRSTRSLNAPTQDGRSRSTRQRLIATRACRAPRGNNANY